MPSKLSLTAAFEYAGSQLLTRGGALLAGVYLLYQLVTQVAFQSLVSTYLAAKIPAEQVARVYPLAVDLPTPVAAAATLVLLPFGTFLGIVAIRALYRNVDDVPTADHLRRPLRTLVVTLAVTLVVSVAIFVGFALLVLPGIFLAVSLAFAVPAVVIEDAGVVEALKRSWSLASGNRLRLFALGFVLVVVSGFVGAAFQFLSLAYPLAASVTSALLTGLISLFGIALLVGAYRQLAGAASTVGAL
ncbi:MAG: hypothetical protein ABEJ78_01120 [Haloferacaceae archaeon]